MDFDVLASKLNVEFDEKTQKSFLNYVELFKKYNSHTNLISKNDEKYLFEKHIFDSLAFNLFVKKYSKPDKILDIGTGGGFPSVPLAFLLKMADIYAVDSTAKKIKFIEEVKSVLRLNNLNPTVARIEELPTEWKETFDVVTSRALGNLTMILEYAIPYLKVGGYFVAYKSIDSQNELENAKNALKILNTDLVEEISYQLPLKENFDRKLLVFKKKKTVSKIYPRLNGLIKKSPL